MRLFIDQEDFARRITGRRDSLFACDVAAHERDLREMLDGSNVLIIGGAGSIGSSFIRQVLRYQPAQLVVVDTNENGLTELVRGLRSTADVTLPKQLQTLPMDFADALTLAAIRQLGPFDVVANFAALKHVRSEKDPFSSAYIVKNNVLKAKQLIDALLDQTPQRFFCVSTDKAVNPVNLMGASKRLMEQLILAYVDQLNVTTARFANVAFSNGSLLDGFLHRLARRQPLAAPLDIKRYFVTAEESGQLCLLGCVLGRPGDIFVPKLSAQHDLKSFTEIAEMLLNELGLTPVFCKSEQEALAVAKRSDATSYPCLFQVADTTGEKPFEEFTTEDEEVDWTRYQSIGVVRCGHATDRNLVLRTVTQIERLLAQEVFSKDDLVDAISKAVPRFSHQETRKYLDEKM